VPVFVRCPKTGGLKSNGLQATLKSKTARMPESDDDLNKTIYSDSAVGHRLSKVRKPGAMFIVFKGKRIPITSRITVGRDADNTIELDDALASRHHAVVQKVKDDFFIEDLNSTNGTHVNGHPVPPGKYVRLHRLDVILIGRTELSLQQFGV
jgi:pSer/pThr/pTyr-binding forkhead associated (FHA) protein